jgi:lipoyl(octanoyl) transferase
MNTFFFGQRAQKERVEDVGKVHKLPLKRMAAFDYFNDSLRVAMVWQLSKGQGDPDELWLLEHFPVYTLGFGASKKNLLIKNDIPVIRSDRGGEVTYHGPGQIVAYFLINLRRKGWGPKRFVNELEASVMDFLKDYGVSSKRQQGNPGVYIRDKKICSVGLKIKRGYSFQNSEICRTIC